MSITQTFDLNLIPEQAPVVVHCDQYDKGTGRLIVKLYEGDVAYTPSGSAVIQGCKPDGHGFQYNAALSGNTVTANLTEQMTIVAGHVRCQIVVTETTGRTGTFVFILDVQKSALPSDTDMSESEYQIVEELLEDIQDYAEDAEAWAVGERGGVPVGPTDPTYNNNAEYWAYQASQYAQGGLVFKGSVAFASIPTTGMSDGDMYNITNDFTTDSRFIEGSGKFCPAGTNIAWVNSSSKWDLLSVMKLGSLDDLNDVDVNAPSNNQVLTYDANSGEWVNANAQGGPTSLDNLTNVDITTPTDGQFLKYDAANQEWVNGSGGGGGATDLDDLTDVSISSPTNGQVLKYNSTSQEWENANESGGGGDYVGLYGMTEIQSSDGQGTTLLDLNQYTSVGNYYCNGKAQISVHIYRYTSPSLRSGSVTITYSSAIFILYVRKMPNNDTVQEMYIKEGDATVYAVLRRYKSSNGWTKWSAGESRSYNGKTPAMYLYSLQGVYIDVETAGDALVYDGSISEWTNKPINKVTTFSVGVSGWTSDTTSQSGTTLYKKQISLTNVYVSTPTVDIGSSGVLPTKAEQESYNLLQYATINDTIPCLYLYASAIPTTAFYINVKGVD